ncbi:aminotransferase yhxA [Niallia sp. 03133]|uniref:aminotransferase yhxA n=1 Tax=Niallia sp. 03133 TaxID=3458060 RepID=UPI004043C9F2
MSKTNKVMTGIISTAFLLNLAACNNDTEDEYTSTQSQNIPDPPKDSNCSQWEWDEDDGGWECEDRHSHYYGHYFYGGRYYSSKSDLYKSSNYKKPSSSRNSSVQSGSSSETSKSVKRSSGFGSGSKSYGG